MGFVKYLGCLVISMATTDTFDKNKVIIVSYYMICKAIGRSLVCVVIKKMPMISLKRRYACVYVNVKNKYCSENTT